MSQVGRLVRLKVKDILADPVYGFNPTLATFADVADVTPFSIDFASEPSLNFFMAQANLTDLLSTTRVKAAPALMLLFAGSRVNNSGSVRQKFKLFTGTVELSIHTYFTYPQSRALPDMETLTDLIEETFFWIFNRPTGQRWGNQIAYNGDISVAPGALNLGADNWQRLIVTQMTFSVVTE